MVKINTFLLSGGRADQCRPAGAEHWCQFHQTKSGLSKFSQNVSQKELRPILVSAGFLPPDYSFGIGCRRVSGRQKPLMRFLKAWLFGIALGGGVAQWAGNLGTALYTNLCIVL
jgi:hypothetical protein